VQCSMHDGSRTGADGCNAQCTTDRGQGPTGAMLNARRIEDRGRRVQCSMSGTGRTVRQAAPDGITRGNRPRCQARRSRTQTRRRGATRPACATRSVQPACTRESRVGLHLGVNPGDEGRRDTHGWVVPGAVSRGMADGPLGRARTACQGQGEQRRLWRPNRARLDILGEPAWGVYHHQETI